MSTERLDDNQGTVRIGDNQSTVRMGDEGGTAIISNSGDADGVVSQQKMDMQGLVSDQKRTGEVFTPGQIIELNDKNCTIESIISMSSGEAVIYKISMDGKPYVLKHYKLDTPLRDEAKEVLRKIKDNPQDRVVKVYDFGRRSEQDFEIMEYAEGGTLDQYLRENGPLHHPEKFRNIVRQITEGLEQLHGELNIIYQDLKPENIYFRDANRTSIILADFGISSPMKPGEKMAKVSANATTIYAAPDLARIGNETMVQVGPPVDYFSFGITMIHLWCGVKPFQGIPETVRISQIRDKDVEFPEDMPTDCKALIQGLIDPLPKTRWGNQYIKRWLAGESPESNYKKTSLTYESRMFNDSEGYSNPKELAELMTKYPDKGITYLYSDKITKWLENAGDDLRHEEIKRTISEYANDKQAGAYFATYILDPSRPFVSNGGKICTTTVEIADALMGESAYYMDELKNPNAKLYLYFEATEGSKGREVAKQFYNNFQDSAYSPKRALNLVWLKFQPDSGQSITIGSKVYQSPEEVAAETDGKQIGLIKNAVQEEDSVFLVWLSDNYGEYFTSTRGYKYLPVSDKFFLLGLLPFLSYKEFDSNWEKNAVSELCALIHNNPGRSDLFETYARQGLPFTGHDDYLDWKPTAINYLSLFFNEIVDRNNVDPEAGLELIRFLHEHKADVNESSGGGSVPLLSAVGKRNVPVVKLLLELGADTDKIIDGTSLLHMALYTFNEPENDKEKEDARIAIANMLLDYKANVNTTDPEGRTPLILAFYLESPGKMGIMTRILEAGAKTDILLNNGYCSPLMAAADANAIEVAELLLKYGAQKDFTDTDDNTAFVYAAQKKHTQMMALLNPGKSFVSRSRLILTAKVLISILAIGSIFLTMDVLARAILTFHFSFPVLAGASFFLSHLLYAYILIVIYGIREYLISLRGTFNYIGSGLVYILGIPIVFPLMVLPLQFLTRLLPPNVAAMISLPAEILTGLPGGIAMLAGFIALLAVMMTGVVFVSRINDKFAKKMRMYKQYT